MLGLRCGKAKGDRMGWERGLYYTRSKKVKGRVVREYVGAGQIGVLAAELDSIERDRREWEAEEWQAVRADLDEIAATLADLNERCDFLTRAALIVAGYRLHKRGEWRKQRVRKETTDAGAEPIRGNSETGRPAADPEQH
jgi:hypothetical protein